MGIVLGHSNNMAKKKKNPNICSWCGKIINALPFSCHRCTGNYCPDHHLPEDHDCPGLKQFKEGIKNRWKNAILGSKNYVGKKEDLPKRDSPNNFFKDIKKWLRRRTYRAYNYSRLERYVWKILLFAAISILALRYIYLNISDLNATEIWIVRFGSLLLLIALFFSIKYGWRVLKEIGNWFKRQRNWLKYGLVIIIIILAWGAYNSQEKYVDPTMNYVKNIDYSILNPLNMEKTSDAGDSLVSTIRETTNPGAEDTIESAFQKLNEIRVENGVSSIRWDDKIYELVKHQASKKLCSTSHCSHMDSDGKYFDYYAPRYGVALGESGENIAGSSCHEAVTLWLHSTTGHREIMLNPRMRRGALAYDRGNCVLVVSS